MTVAEVRDRTRATANSVEADQGARRLDRSGRLLHVVGVGLLLVDATALVVIFGFLLNIDWSRPDPANLVTVLALSIFGAAVQAVLAVHLGRRLWAWRHTDRTEDGIAVREFPPRSAVIVLGGALLLALSALAAGALYLRVQREGVIAEAGDLAGVLGVLLGASALAAPWCLVADEAYGPGPDARLLSAGGLILARSDRRQRRQARGARRSLATATRRLRHAEWLLAATVHAIGRDHLAVQRRLLAARGLAWGTTTLSAAHLLPSSGVAAGTGARAVLPILIAGDHRCLTGPIERLRDALASAEGEFLGVVDRVDPDELDLAG